MPCLNQGPGPCKQPGLDLDLALSPVPSGAVSPQPWQVLSWQLQGQGPTARPERQF
jgi:hypothetical protein